MSESLTCPICTMADIAEAGDNYECVTCGHEWPLAEEPISEREVCDCNGNPLVSGDSVAIIKDLKVKGTSNTIKVGTKVKGIRLIDGDHEIDGKVEGRGVLIKAMFVRKV